MPSRSGPPETSGRWFALPQPETDATRRAHAAADVLLERHGVVTRGAVAAERVPGGFAAIYKVLSAFEESGRARRGYFIEGLGAAQFGTSGAVDRLRATTHVEPVTLAAILDTMRTFGEPESFEAAFASLAHGVRRGALGKLVVETADGTALLSSGPREIALREAMEAAGFVASPRGLRLRR